MFEDIFKRRSLISESQRRKPVDGYEVFHASKSYKVDTSITIFS